MRTGRAWRADCRSTLGLSSEEASRSGWSTEWGWDAPRRRGASRPGSSPVLEAVVNMTTSESSASPPCHVFCVSSCSGMLESE